MERVLCSFARRRWSRTTRDDLLDRFGVTSFQAHHDRLGGHVSLPRRRQRAVQANLELVHLVQDSQVLQVLRARSGERGQELGPRIAGFVAPLSETRTETKILAARMGPTVWLEDGPTPMENKSEGRIPR